MGVSHSQILSTSSFGWPPNHLLRYTPPFGSGGWGAINEGKPYIIVDLVSEQIPKSILILD
jgi:hypothetical protein